MRLSTWVRARTFRRPLGREQKGAQTQKEKQQQPQKRLETETDLTEAWPEREAEAPAACGT